MLSAYRELAADREAQGIPALPLTAEQTQALTELLQQPPAGEDEALLHLLSERIPPGVDEAAYVKATWLSAVAQGQATSPLVSPLEATDAARELLGADRFPTIHDVLSRRLGIHHGSNVFQGWDVSGPDRGEGVSPPGDGGASVSEILEVLDRYEAVAAATMRVLRSCVEITSLAHSFSPAATGCCGWVWV